MNDLDKITKKNPFRVPENYFEEVNRKIVAATTGEETAPSKKGFLRKLRPALAAAATVTVLVLLGYGAMRVFTPVNNNLKVPEISLGEFSEIYLNDIDIVTLEENSDPVAIFDNVPNVSNSEIIDYLLSLNVDINEIYELL